MTISNKLLVEQAWSLRTNLDRQIQTERIRKTPGCTPATRIARLNSAQERAYSRYLRRLKVFWA